MRKINTLYLFTVIFMLAHLLMSNSGNPPNGKAGAPGDGTCADCHNGGGFGGTMTLLGLPAQVTPNTTYTVTMLNTFAGAVPDLSGFQLTARDASNNDAGTIVGTSGNASTATFGGKTYVEHSPAEFFGGANSVMWTFDWTAPNGVNGESYTFFYSGVFGDGNGSTSGDMVTGGATTVQLNVPTPLAASANTLQNVTCNGDGNGVAAVNTTGGTPPYTIDWSNGSQNSTIANLAADTYTVTVEDALGQMTIATTTITEPPVLQTIVTSQIDLSCTSSIAVATVTGTGGTPNYNYSWSTGLQAPTATFTAAGEYMVTVSDSNGCTDISTIQINGSADFPIAVAQSGGDLDCLTNATSLDATGSSAVSGQAGFVWINPAGTPISTTSTATANTPGTYTLIVTDMNNGCTSSAQVTVLQNGILPAAMITTNGNDVLTCQQDTLVLNAETDALNANYTWQDSNGMVIGMLDSVVVNQAGMYTLIVTNPTNACESQTSIMVMQNTNIPNVSATVDGVLSCANAAVSLTATTTSTGAFTYQWSNEAGTVIATDATTTVSIADTYTVMITDTITNCSNNTSISVPGVMDLPIADAGPAQTLTCDEVTVTLDGSNSSTGSNYAYEWFTSSGSVISTDVTAFTPLTGVYTLVVTDNTSGCTSASQVEVSENMVLPTAIGTVIGELNCQNMMVTLDGSGSSTGNEYVYGWANANGTTIANSITATVSQAGMYTLSVFNTNNACVGTTTVMVNNNVATPTVSLGTIDELSCTVNTIDINPSVSGSTNFTCVWTDANGTILSNNGNCGLTVSQVGNYTLVVTDTDTACTTETSATVTSNSLTVDANATVSGVLDCNNTAVNLNASGSSIGTGITYTWTGPNGFMSTLINPLVTQAGNYVLAVTDTNTGCMNSTSVEVMSENIFPGIFIDTPQTLSCGVNTVTLNANVSAAFGSIDYLWTTVDGNILSGVNSAMAEVSSVGTYTLVATNTVSGCAAESSVQVTAESAMLNITDFIINVSCFGEATGGISTTISGGVEPYSYLWSTGETTSNISNLAVGTYTLEVMDNEACSASATYTITQPDELVATTSFVNETSAGAGDGSATLSVTGGAMPYSYLWSNSATSASISNLTTGIYTATVTDGNNCTATAIAAITGSGGDCILQVSAVPTDVACFGISNGSAIATAIGGTGMLNYSWSDGQTTEMLTNVVAGTYTLTVTDAENCEATTSVTIGQPEPIGVIIGNIINVDCLTSTGSAEVNVEGGTPPYSFDLGNGITSPTDLAVGSYTISVTDANGCIAESNFDITENVNSPAVTITGDLLITCQQAEVSVQAVVEGITNYSIEWLSNDMTIGTDSSITLNMAGEYCVRVTNTDDGCTTKNLFTIINTSSMMVSSTTTNVMCNGEATGTATVSVSNGLEPYSYAWPTGETTASVSGLAAGDYVVTISDVGSCVVTSTITITEPSTLELTASNIVNIDCLNSTGTADISSTGGTPPYSYDYSYGSPMTPLVAGTYSVTVTDANNCTTQTSFDITENINAPNVTINGAMELTCTQSEVSLEAVVMGIPNYSVEWLMNEMVIGTTNMISLSTTGAYCLLVTNTDDGCSTKEVFTILDTASDIMLNTTATDVLCNGEASGTASVSIVNAGVGTALYEWSNGATTTSINDISAGAYSVTVTADNGCSASATVTISEPSPISMTIVAIENITCASPTGSIDLDIIGGTPPLVYDISGPSTTINELLDAGSYTITATDANNCTASVDFELTADTIAPEVTIIGSETVFCSFDGEVLEVSTNVLNATYEWLDANGTSIGTTTTLPISAVGMYTVIVTNTDNACTASDSIEVTEDIEQPDISVSGNLELTCGEPTTDITATSSTMNASYEWMDESGTILTNMPTVTIAACGTYTVVATNNNNGCTSSSSIIVLCDMDTPVANAGPDMVGVITCMDSQPTLILDATGSSVGAAFTYTWTTLDGNFVDLSNPLAPVVDAVGLYTLTVTNDATGCTASDAVSVLSFEENITVPIADISNVNTVVCSEDEFPAILDGSASSSGDEFTYTWTDEAGMVISTETTAEASGVGFYTLVVTNTENGCTSSTTAQVVVDDFMAAYALQETCFSNEGTMAFVITQDGFPPYSYQWGNGMTTETIPVNPGEVISVTVTDGLGCTVVLPNNEPVVIVYDFIDPIVDVVITDATGSNSDGAIDLTLLDGLTAISIQWSNGETTEDISGLAAGVYMVTIEDANGCFVSDSFVVEMMVNTSELPENGAISIFPNPNTGQFSIEWETDLQEPVQVSLVDFMGKEVLTIRDLDWTQSQQLIDAKDLSAGLYMVNFFTSKGLIASKKVMLVD